MPKIFKNARIALAFFNRGFSDSDLKKYKFLVRLGLRFYCKWGSWITLFATKSLVFSSAKSGPSIGPAVFCSFFLIKSHAFTVSSLRATEAETSRASSPSLRHSFHMVDASGTSTFHQWHAFVNIIIKQLQGPIFIHSKIQRDFQNILSFTLLNLRSVKIVQKSVKSQGIFQLLMSGNPDLTLNIVWASFYTQVMYLPVNFSRSGNFAKRSGKILEVRKSQWKVRELYFFHKASEKWSIWVAFAGIVALITDFQYNYFIIHLANLRSVKIVQKSVKSQGIFQLLMSGNPDLTLNIVSVFLYLHYKYMLFAGWEVHIVKTVTEVLKMLPKAAGWGQHFQDRGHSFSLYGPT